MFITTRLASAVRDSALRRAEELGVAASIVVMDVGGYLKTFHRMDGAWLGSIDIASRTSRV
jgi:uncharacterized protein GlcG (DUF336 family)